MRSEISARARRRAFAFGSLARNGLIGRAALTEPPRAGRGGGAEGAAGARLIVAGGTGRGGGGNVDPDGIEAGRGGCGAGGIEAGRGGCGTGGVIDCAGGGPGGASGGSPPTGNVPDGRPPPNAEIPCVATGVGMEDARGGGDGAATAGGAGTPGVARVAGCAIGGVGALPKCSDEPWGAAGRGVALGMDVPAAGVGAAPSRDTVITPPHTAQRARTLAPGIRPGSTRKTERHSGHETFISGAPPPLPRPDRSPRGRLEDLAPPACCRSAGRWRRPIPAASWRSSSFPLRVRSLVPRV